MRFGLLVYAVGTLAVTAFPAVASAKIHDFGPHTKTQVYAICTDAQGHRTGGSGKWGCVTVRWTIACISSGKTCTIELLSPAPESIEATVHSAGSGGGGGVTPTSTSQPGHGLSGAGGASGVGGHMGGGTTGAVGH